MRETPGGDIPECMSPIHLTLRPLTSSRPLAGRSGANLPRRHENRHSGAFGKTCFRMKRYFGIKANKTLSIYREKVADYNDVFIFFLSLAIRSLSGFENRPFSLDD